MANPITWRTINTGFDAGDAIQATALAGQQIGQAFTGLENILKTVQENRKQNAETLANNAVADFKSRLASMTPEQLLAAQQSGQIDALRQQLLQQTPVYIDPNQIGNDAVQNTLEERMQDVQALNTYQDVQHNRALRPVQDQFYEQLNQGNLDAARKLALQLDGEAGKEAMNLWRTQSEETKRKSAFAGAAQLASNLDNWYADYMDAPWRQTQAQLRALGVPLDERTGQPLWDQVKDPSVLNKAKKLVESTQQPTATGAKRALRQKLLDTLGQYAGTQEGQLLLENTLAMFDTTGQLAPQDQAALEEQQALIDRAYNQDNNLFAQAANEQKELKQEDIQNLLLDLRTKGDDPLDPDDLQNLTKEAYKFATRGIEIGGEYQPIPLTVIKAFLASADDPVFSDSSMEDALREFVTQGDLGKQFEDYRKAQQEKLLLNKAFKTNAGLYSRNNPGALLNQVNEAKKKLLEAGKQRYPSGPSLPPVLPPGVGTVNIPADKAVLEGVLHDLSKRKKMSVNNLVNSINSTDARKQELLLKQIKHRLPAGIRRNYQKPEDLKKALNQYFSK